MVYAGITLISFGFSCLVFTCILVAKGYGKPIVGGLSRSTRKALGAVTRRFSRR